MSTEETRIPPAGDPFAAAEARKREQHRKEDAYGGHRDQERYWPEERHPDGCFYCGSHGHTSDCCTDREEIVEFWRS